MALEDHLRLGIVLGGVWQVKPSSISVSFDSGAQRVDTLEGLAGKTPGAGSVSISITAAVPAGGPEYDWLSACADGNYENIVVPFGAKAYTGNGWFQTAGGSQSVNANTETTCEWVGELKPLQ